MGDLEALLVDDLVDITSGSVEDSVSKQDLDMPGGHFGFSEKSSSGVAN